MINQRSALTIYSRKDHLLDVRTVLRALSIATIKARNCLEAAVLLRGEQKPQVIFTDAILPDGNWMDVMGLTTRSAAKVPVVVVSPDSDNNLYSKAKESGVFDCLTEASTIPDIVKTLQNALELEGNDRPTTAA